MCIVFCFAEALTAVFGDAALLKCFPAKGSDGKWEECYFSFFGERENMIFLPLLTEKPAHSCSLPGVSIPPGNDDFFSGGMDHLKRCAAWRISHFEAMSFIAGISKSCEDHLFEGMML